MAKVSAGIATVSGQAELKKTLAGLTDKMQRKVIRKAVAKGGQSLVKTTREQIKSMVSGSSRSKRRGKAATGSLAKAITKRAWSVPRKGIIATVVGADYKKAPHAHLVEYGHDIVVGGEKKSGGRVVGRARPVPFTRIANRKGGRPAVAAMQQKARDEIRKLKFPKPKRARI